MQAALPEDFVTIDRSLRPPGRRRPAPLIIRPFAIHRGFLDGPAQHPLLAEVRRIGTNSQMVDPDDPGERIDVNIADRRPLREVGFATENYVAPLVANDFLLFLRNSVFVTVAATVGLGTAGFAVATASTSSDTPEPVVVKREDTSTSWTQSTDLDDDVRDDVDDDSPTVDTAGTVATRNTTVTKNTAPTQDQPTQNTVKTVKTAPTKNTAPTANTAG